MLKKPRSSSSASMSVCECVCVSVCVSLSVWVCGSGCACVLSLYTHAVEVKYLIIYVLSLFLYFQHRPLAAIFSVTIRRIKRINCFLHPRQHVSVCEWVWVCECKWLRLCVCLSREKDKAMWRSTKTTRREHSTTIEQQLFRKIFSGSGQKRLDRMRMSEIMSQIFQRVCQRCSLFPVFRKRFFLLPKVGAFGQKFTLEIELENIMENGWKHILTIQIQRTSDNAPSPLPNRGYLIWLFLTEIMIARKENRPFSW